MASISALAGFTDTELMGELGRRGKLLLEHPIDPFDLAALLHSDPDRAADAMRQCKVAGPWGRAADYEADDDDDPARDDDPQALVREGFGSYEVAQVDYELAWETCAHCGERHRTVKRWSCNVLGRSIGWCDTREEAIAAADAALVEAGWALAGGAR